MTDQDGDGYGASGVSGSETLDENDWAIGTDCDDNDAGFISIVMDGDCDGG